MATWQQIRFNYRLYTSQFSERGGVSIAGMDKPTKESRQTNMNLRMQVETPLDREYLIQANDRRHDIRYLSPEMLNRLPIGLTHLLQIQITEDHIEYWKHTLSELREHNTESESVNEHLVENFSLLVDLLTLPLTISQNIDNEQAARVLSSPNILAGYLSYPTLEGFLKEICSKDINMDGKVKPGRKVRKLSPTREYHTQECSDIGSLLWHLETEVASPSLRTRLYQMRQEMALFFGCDAQHAYGEVKSERNDSLHGYKMAEQEFGVILNIICLVAWEFIFPS